MRFLFGLCGMLAVLAVGCKSRAFNETSGTQGVQGDTQSLPPNGQRMGDSIKVGARPVFMFHWTEHTEDWMRNRDTLIPKILRDAKSANAKFSPNTSKADVSAWGYGMYLAGDYLQSYSPRDRGETLVVAVLKPGAELKFTSVKQAASLEDKALLQGPVFGIAYPYMAHRNIFANFSVVLREPIGSPDMAPTALPIDFKPVHVINTKVSPRPLLGRSVPNGAQSPVALLEVFADRFEWIANLNLYKDYWIDHTGRLTGEGISQAFARELTANGVNGFSQAYAAVKGEANMFNNPFRGTGCETSEADCRILTADVIAPAVKKNDINKNAYKAGFALLSKLGIVNSLEVLQAPAEVTQKAVADGLRARYADLVKQMNDVASGVMQMNAVLQRDSLERVINQK